MKKKLKRCWYIINCTFLVLLALHSSEIRGFSWMKLSSETLQNLPYFWSKKTQIDIVEGHPLLKIQSCSKWKLGEKIFEFSYSKIMVNLEAFHKTILSSINLLFLKSASVHHKKFLYFSLLDTSKRIRWVRFLLFDKQLELHRNKKFQKKTREIEYTIQFNSGQVNQVISARGAIKLRTFGTGAERACWRGAILLPLKHLSSNCIISALFYWLL